jgi:hypothetical protein
MECLLMAGVAQEGLLEIVLIQLWWVFYGGNLN